MVHVIGQPLTECQKEYQKNLRSLQPFLLRYVPRCSADGSYQQVQCAGGVCYCVTPQGKQIPGSKTFNSARQPNCTEPGKLKHFPGSHKVCRLTDSTHTVMLALRRTKMFVLDRNRSMCYMYAILRNIIQQRVDRNCVFEPTGLHIFM